ncbi:Crp/Fnr family transcriptional regulator [Undibacterium sp. FT147W]|uniref:Crp/Fnr family transcriptional regulator n=1 Tax=Undibacterium rivi TaxID=2828729 RepID=A0ABS5GZX2_9BURK|nr:Crp/Fnr family transcriptional regulator [Undibacterium rivi]MBR7791274.1 Crp/Fnr family transcriptional regulator [Undibacterium rivi]
MPPSSVLNSLAGDDWFAALPAATRKEMLDCSEKQYLQPGEMLFRQGDPPAGFYALLSGKLKMSTLSEDGREAILTILEPGTWFGEISLIDGKPRTHDATAIGRAEVLMMTPACFDHLMQGADFALAVAQMLAQRIRLLYGIVEDAHLRSARARVARRLVLLANSEKEQGESEKMEIPVSQESLAMMLGMSRQSLSKELKFFEHAELIRLGYRSIRISSLDKLRALCEKD